MVRSALSLLRKIGNFLCNLRCLVFQKSIGNNNHDEHWFVYLLFLLEENARYRWVEVEQPRFRRRSNSAALDPLVRELEE